QREVEHAVRRLTALRLQLRDTRRECLEILWRTGADALVEHARVHPMFDLLRLHTVVFDRLTYDVAEPGIVHPRVARDGENSRVVVDKVAMPQTRQRGQDLSLCEVAASPEDDERAWPVNGPPMRALALLSQLRVLDAVRSCCFRRHMRCPSSS